MAEYSRVECLIQQEIKHEKDKELQQKLAQQEKKHEEDKELQQQLVQQEKRYKEQLAGTDII